MIHPEALIAGFLIGVPAGIFWRYVVFASAVVAGVFIVIAERIAVAAGWVGHHE